MKVKNNQSTGIEEIMELPMIALRGLSEFPNRVRYFDIGRRKSISAINDAIIGEHRLLLVPHNDGNTGLLTADDLCRTGTICMLKKVHELPGGTVRVLVEGLDMGEIEEVIDEEPHFRCKVRRIREDGELTDEMDDLLRQFDGADEIDAGNLMVDVVLDKQLEAFDEGGSVITDSITEALAEAIATDGPRTADDAAASGSSVGIAFAEGISAGPAHWEEVEINETFWNKVRSIRKRNIVIMVVAFILVIGGILAIALQSVYGGTIDKKTVNVTEKIDDEIKAE